jgi:hypothetical protein
LAAHNREGNISKIHRTVGFLTLGKKFLGKISWTALGPSGLGNFADRQVPIRVQHEGAILRRCTQFFGTVTPNIALLLGSSHVPRDVKLSGQ